MNPKAAIYCRLSEEDKNKRQACDSESIQNQKSMLTSYAHAQGWEIYGVYSDDDYAGADRKRPEFNRLLKDAKQRKFDIILCKTQSRFTRELELVEKYIHGLFPVWGIRFVSIVDNADTDNRGNKKSRQINGLVNEWYLEDMSDNIRSVLTDKRRNGQHIGSFALYGYKKDPNQKGHLIIDEEAAAVVREVFALFVQGYGKTAIARILNERGIPNPTEYKRLHGMRYKQPKSKNGTLWKYPAIADMLKNEIYAGNMVQGKYGSVSYKTKQNKPRPKDSWYRVEGTHTPIIDEALWNQTQLLLEQKTKPFQGGTIGLFAKKARCAGCGYVLRSSKNHGRHYLRCPSRHAAKNACAGAFISVEKLEQTVIRELNRLVEEYLDTDAFNRALKTPCLDCFAAQKERLLSDMAKNQKKAGEYGKIMRELYMDKARGILTEEDFIELSKEFAAQRDLFLRAAADNKKQLSETEEKQKEAGNRGLKGQNARVTCLNRIMVEQFIDYISVGRRASGAKDVPVEIHWNF